MLFSRFDPTFQKKWIRMKNNITLIRIQSTSDPDPQSWIWRKKCFFFTSILKNWIRIRPKHPDWPKYPDPTKLPGPANTLSFIKVSQKSRAWHANILEKQLCCILKNQFVMKKKKKYTTKKSATFYKKSAKLTRVIQHENSLQEITKTQ